MSQVLANSLFSASGYILVGLSFSLIYATTRFFHFAHGAVYTAAAYLAYAFTRVVGVDPIFSIMLGILGAAALGCLMEICAYRPLRCVGTSPQILLLVSLGMFVVIQNIISVTFGDDVKMLRVTLVEEGVSFLDARLTHIQLVAMTISLLCVTAAGLVFKSTGSGRMIRCVANDPELAGIVGVRTDNVILGAFFIGSALAGGAAILAAFDTGLTPLMGFNALLTGVVVAIMGGIGSISGLILGGLLIGLTRNLGAWWLPTQWQDAIVFIILILFLLFRPQGFLGKPLRQTTV